MGVSTTTEPLITKEQALDIIGSERLTLLRECHPKGFVGWEVVRALEQGTYMSETTRANIVHDGAVAHARSVFPEVMCGMQRRLFVLDFEGRLLVRFKLLDGKLASKGIPTGQAVFLGNQDQIFGSQTTVWPKAPMIISGYTLDALGTAIQRLVLVLSVRGEVVWEHDLLTPIATLGATAEEAGEAQAQ